MTVAQSPRTVRFGAFELDTRAGELTRSGRRVHLPPQASRLLVLLATRAGDVVTREEIREMLWGEDTYVEFEPAVNACISQIRAALGDKPTTPRFIETLARRGYRFVAPVTAVTGDQTALPANAAGSDSASTVLATDAAVDRRSRVSPVWAAVAAALVAVSATLMVTDARPWGNNSLSSRDRYARRSLLALEKFERGISDLADAGPSELLDRVEFFRTAIAAEPDFAEAYAALADAKLILAVYRTEAPPIAYPEAKAAAAKAIALDDSLGEAHAAYAAAVLYFDWDWHQAEVHFTRALQLAPDSARVHQRYGRYLSALGRGSEALRHARRAVELAPTSPSARTDLGVVAFYAGQLAESQRQCERALNLMREFTPAQRCLDAVTSAAASPDPILLPAASLARAGCSEEAIDWLQRAANRRTDSLVYVAVHQAFAPLRTDPRFVGVLQRVGLPAHVDSLP
jgi:DNA-binding winged helix-turn-helix (wHTH) protein/tetratricopeptide (TPR) repeat protein